MLERLMELCWNQDATQRPSAKDILTTSHMMSADFLAQHKHFPRELEEVDFVTSVTEVNQQPYRHKFATITNSRAFLAELRKTSQMYCTASMTSLFINLYINLITC